VNCGIMLLFGGWGLFRGNGRDHKVLLRSMYWFVS
jgi:hypothetical protein